MNLINFQVLYLCVLYYYHACILQQRQFILYSQLPYHYHIVDLVNSLNLYIILLIMNILKSNKFQFHHKKIHTFLIYQDVLDMIVFKFLFLVNALRYVLLTFFFLKFSKLQHIQIMFLQLNTQFQISLYLYIPQF